MPCPPGRALVTTQLLLDCVGRDRVWKIVSVKDWRAWHEHYDDSNSSLSRRLRVVQQRLGDVLSSATSGTRLILCLCAGDGRDVIPVLADQPAEARPLAVLVEIDPALAASAKRRAEDTGVDVEVIVGDAGLSRTWQDILPVDLLMLCGIFGNIGFDDIQATVRGATRLLRPNGIVIWTRGCLTGEDDLRPQIREWFADCGFEELSFDSEPTGCGVGVNRLTSTNSGAELPERLFTFVP